MPQLPKPPLIPGEFPTIAAALDYAAGSSNGIRFHDNHGAITGQLSYKDLRTRALDIACRLKGMGFEREHRIGVVAETGPEFLSIFYGCQYAGLVPCPLPVRPRIGGSQAYDEQIGNMLRTGDIRTLIILPGQPGMDRIPADQVTTFIDYDTLLQKAPGPLPDTITPDDAAYIQFSSGSTSNPKGILITQRAVAANAEAILKYGMRLNSSDRAFSWLPFYHDMGLVGFSIAPLFGQCPIDYLPAIAFARRPVLWLRLMAEYGSTITYSPSFGYRLAAQRYLSEPETLDLSHLRITGIGGDMIHADILYQFAEALKETGFKAEAFLPSYGMAEATLAISFGKPGAGFEVDTVDRAKAETDGTIELVSSSGQERLPVRSFVVCGFPLPGTDIRIVSEESLPLPDKRIGHVLFRGPNMMREYVGNPEETGHALRPDGYLETGDLGYLREGRIVITGRTKDVILYRGRNVWPEDIEWTAEQALKLNHGNVVAFSLESENGGDDQVVILVQSRTADERERTLLTEQVHQAISQTYGISSTVVPVPHGTIPKTSSGKLARARARTIFNKLKSEV